MFLFLIRITLGLEFDLVADKQDGFPETICRKCTSVITSYALFKKAVESGQNKLKIISEARKNRLKLAAEASSSSPNVRSNEANQAESLEDELEKMQTKQSANDVQVCGDFAFTTAP